MHEKSKILPQIFHMSLVEPLLLIVIPVFGIYLSVMLLLSKPMEVELYVPILILVFCIFAMIMGLMMPRKLEIQVEEMIINYLVWKRIVNVSEVKSFTLDKGQAGRRGTRYFVTIQLNKGGKIRFKDIKEGNESLLMALEKWMGSKPMVDVHEEVVDEKMKDLPGIEQKLRPPEPLSELTEQLVRKMFLPDDQMEVRQLLIDQCGNNIYAHEHKDKYELEGLRFSVLKVSKGDLKKMHRAIKAANQDIRDIYAESGFMGEKAEEKREKWVRSVLNKK